METAGFDFSQQDIIEMKIFDKNLVQKGLDVINEHIVSLGGKVENPSNFDATK